MHHNLMNDLIKIIDSAGIAKEFHIRSPQVPFDYLSISLPSETDSELIYSAIIRTQSKEETGQLFPVDITQDIIQIVHTFPFKVKQEQVNDISRLINYINTGVSLPCFGYDEAVNQCYYKSSFLVSSGSHNPNHPTFILTTLRLVNTFLDLYTSPIKNVAMGIEKIQDTLNICNKSFSRRFP